MRSSSSARATRRCSASSIGSFAPRSCHAACGRERSCHPRGSSPRCSACRAPAAAVAAYEQLLAEGYTAGRHGSGTDISPGSSRADRGRPAAAQEACGGRSRPTPRRLQPLGDFVDVTVQSDQRPFNLGRTLIDDRTLELWRKLSVTYPFVRWMRTIWLFRPARNDRTSKGHLRLPASRPRGEMRSRTDRGHGGNAAGDRHRHPDPSEPGGLGRRSGLSADATGPAGRRRDGPSSSRRCARHRRRQRHRIGTECQRRVRDLPPIPDRCRSLMARRLELLAWARKKDAWIVEDDYASEFRYGGRPLASLQGLDEGERVIYIGTLNKAPSGPAARLRRDPARAAAAVRCRPLFDGPATIDVEPGRGCRLHGRRPFRRAYSPHARVV